MKTATPPNITTDHELRAEGWEPLEIHWLPETYQHHRYGTMRAFDVVGQVPSSQGIYLFTLGRGIVDVRYCGESGHLWMVTRGRRPGTPGRAGNQYGRPKWAGDTRQWVNSRLTQHLDEEPRTWTRAMPCASEDELLSAENACIDRWELWRYGWNRTRPLRSLLRLFDDP